MGRCTAASPATTRTSRRCCVSTACRPKARRSQSGWSRLRRQRPRWCLRLPRRARGVKSMIRQLDDKVMVSAQVAPHEVAGLAEQGVTMLVNNRPDGEEPDQPLAVEIEDAAAA